MASICFHTGGGILSDALRRMLGPEFSAFHFSYITLHYLGLWHHDLPNQYGDLLCQVWWRSINSLGRYHAHKFSYMTLYDLNLWPLSLRFASSTLSPSLERQTCRATLTPWPWIPNQFTYPSWWVTMSSLMEIHQLTKEILHPESSVTHRQMQGRTDRRTQNIMPPFCTVLPHNSFI